MAQGCTEGIAGCPDWFSEAEPTVHEEDATTKPNPKVEATAEQFGDTDDADDETTTAEIEPDDPDDTDDTVDIDEIEDLEDLEELDETDLDDSIDGDGDEDSLDDDVVVGVVTPVRGPEPAEGATDAETDDDELQAEEVEASLDVILAERLRGDVGEIDEPIDDEDDDDDDDEAPNQLATIIPVRQPDEFLCQSCFLLKPPGQLADADHQLCRDCA